MLNARQIARKSAAGRRLNDDRTEPIAARRTGRGAGGRLSSAPAIAASRLRSCSRRSRSSTCPARTSASACTSPPTRRAASSACGRTSPSRCRATTSRRRRPVPPQSFCYLGPVFRNRGDGSGRSSCRPASNSFGRPDKAAADAEMLALGLDAIAHYGVAAPDIRMGDVGLFAALVAALDLAPAWKRRLVKDFNRKTSLAHDLDVLTLDRRQRAAGIPGRARGAGRLRSEGARARWSPICCRSPASARSAAARSARSPSASSSRRRSAPATRCRSETRALIEKFLAIARRSRRGRRRAARAGRRRQASRSVPRSTCSRAAPASSPRAASMSRASGSRPRSAAASTTTPASCSSCTIRPRARRPAGRRRPLRRPARRGSAPRRRSRRSALRSGSSGSRPAGGAA